MPLSLAYISAKLRKEGNEVKLVDCIAEKKNIQNLLQISENISVEMFILNTAYPSIEMDKKTAKILKEKFPKAKIVIIGLFPTLLEKKALEFFEAVDFGVIGEPEWVVSKLTDNLDRDGDLREVKGLMWKDKDEIVVNAAQDISQNNLDELPFPARDLLDNSKYILPTNGKKFTLLSVGRGCPFSCIYCTANIYYGKKFRKRLVKSVVDEIEECVNKYDIKNFLFWGESFTIDQKYGEEICDEILRRNLKITWSTTSRVDTLNETLLAKMKKSGCALLGLGIESAVQEILDTAQKGTNLEKINRAVAMVKKSGIQSMAHFIVGLPGETKETARKSIDFAVKSGTDFAQFYCSIPYPKTKLGEIAKENNWIESDDYVQFDLTKSIMRNESLSSKEIKKLRDKAYRRFYFRPKMFWQTLKEVKSLKSFISSMDFLKWIKTDGWFKKYQNKILLALIVGLFLFLTLTRLNPTLLYTPDASSYIILSNTFFSHTFYHDYSMPENPVHILYPPMYPLMLLPATFFFGESILAAKAVSVIWAVLMLLGLYFLLKKSFGEKWALLGIFLASLSPIVIIFSTEVMAEISALMFAVYALFFLLKFREKFLWRYVFLSGMFIGFATLSRSIWISLIPVAILWLLLEKKWKQGILILLVSLAVIIPWQWRDKYQSEKTGMGGGSYVSQILTMDLDPEAPNLALRFVKRIGNNVGYYQEYVSRMTNTPVFDANFSFPAYRSFFSPMSQKSEKIIFSAAITLILLGLFRSFWQNNKTRLVALAVLAHFTLLMIFPYKEIRYLVPLIPFFLLFLFLGMALAASWLEILVKKIFPKFNISLVFVFLFLLVVFFSASNFYVNWQSSKQNIPHFFMKGAISEALRGDYKYEWGSKMIGVGKWLRQNSSKESIIIQSRKELYFYSQRMVNTSEPVTQITVDEFDWMVFGSGAEYIVEETFVDKSPLDTKRLGSSQYDIFPEVSVEDLTIFKVEEKLFQEEFSNPNYDRELSFLADAANRNPMDFSAVNNLGVFLLKNKQYVEALKVLEDAVKLDPGSAQARFNLATAFLENEKYEEAEENFNAAKQIQFVHRLVPLIKNNLEIINILKKADLSEEAKEKNDLYNQVALLYFKRGKYDRAKHFLEKAEEIYPNDAITQTGFGRVKEAQGDYKKAEEFYQKALKLNPQDKSITPFLYRVQMSEILKTGGKKEITLEGQKILVDSKKAESFNTLGIFCFKTGETVRAIAMFKKAIELKENYASPYENLGLLYENIGKFDKAKINYQKAYELNPARTFPKERLKAFIK